MALVNRSALVPYSAQQMFILVDDISSYPVFLPWCKNANVLVRGTDTVEASIELSKGGITKTFTTRNRNKEHSLIEMSLVNGPFKHLNGFWRFESFDERGCKVILNIDFQFSNFILEKTVGPIFTQVCNTLVESFVKRAQDLYGRK